MFKKILFVFALAFTISACDSGDSDSGAMVEPTLPGTNVPASFVGVYTGNLTVTAQALSLSETDTFPITVTVTQDAMVRFDGDDPDETFTVGLANDGRFAGNLPVDVIEECTGNLSVEGRIDGTTASGDANGEGRCRVSGINIDVTLSGNFSATR